MPAARATPLPYFELADFDAFEKHKQRDSAFNSERLKVKRKLAAMSKAMLPLLEEEGLALTHQTSLSHPYTYNAYRVDSMWAYFSRPEKEKKLLRQIFGRALGKDLDPSFMHVLLLVGIDHDAAEVSLKIHSSAWWDGQNLKNRCSQDEGVQEFTALLNALPGFVLSIHDWRKEYRCGELYRSDVQNYFEYYTPGTHWLHLRRRYPRDAEAALGEEWMSTAGNDLRALAPVYRFTAWTEKNNHLGLSANE